VAEVNQIRAVADYRKSVINFERSLEAGISGGGSTLQLLTSGVGGRASSAAALGASAAGNN
jgi:hypothetical protein